jgi:hypothetical protein
MDTHEVAIPTSDLPDAIAGYLVAHQARDLDTAMRHYAADAAVTDEGQTYVGHTAIRAWLARSASEYTYTTELISATQSGDDRFDAVHHLEGDFPGGVVDLHFHFTLHDGLISRLVIEP